MSSKNQQKCSVCGQPVRTAFGAIPMRTAPLVCRRCFGDTTYNVTPVYHQSVGVKEAPAEG